MGLINAAIKNKKIVLFLVVIAIISGFYCYHILPKQESPDVSSPAAMITTIYPGGSPSDIESLVTKKIEEKVEEIDGYDYCESYSENSASIVILYLNNDADKDKAWRDLRDKIKDLKSELPDGCQDSQINTKLTESAGMILSVSGDSYSYEQLGNYADEIKKQLSNVSGVSRFDIEGKQDKQVKVNVDLSKINKNSISLEDVCRVLQAQNIEIPSGNLDLSTGKIKVQTPGSFTSLKDIENTIVNVSKDTGQTIKIKEIANVQMDYDDDSNYKYTNNGENAVLLAGYFQDNKNIVLIGDDVKKKLDEIKTQLPQDLKIDEVSFQPKDVNESVSFFMDNLRDGVILVVITVLIGMGFRNAMVVSAVIPISMAMSFIIMDALGIKVQQMSTTALIIALGILVDDAIVIGDVVQVGIDNGMPGDEAAFHGIKKLFVPVFTSTLIIVGAFSPLLKIPGAVGDFLRTLPQVVMICIICSYISALFITPAMSSMFFTKSKAEKESKIRKMFHKLLTYGLKHKIKIVIAAICVFIVSMGLMKLLGMEFFPHADKDILYIDVSNEKVEDIDSTSNLVKQIEDVLKSKQEVTGVTSAIGGGMPKFYMTLPDTPPSKSTAQIMVKVDIKKTKKFDTREKLAEYLQSQIDSTISGGTATVKLLEQAQPIGAPIRLRLTGDDLDKIYAASDQIQEKLRNIPGTLNIRDDAAKKTYEYEVNIDSTKAMQHGLLKSDILKQINIALKGYSSSVYRKNGNDYDILVKTNIASVEDLKNLQIKSSLGDNKVLLSEVASIDLNSQLDQIKHYKKDKTVTIYSDVKAGCNSVKIEDELNQEISKMDLNGVNVIYDGEKHQIETNFTSLGVAGVLCIVIIYVILFVQFKSFIQPFVIMCSLPLSLMGVSIGLLVFRMSISLTAVMGIISLIGVVIRNAILLVEYIIDGRKEGLSIDEACLHAVSQRFRPIILSSTATITGLIPLAFSKSALFGPMSVAIIFGLASATFLTFVVVPVVYSLVNTRLEEKPINIDKLNIKSKIAKLNFKSLAFWKK
ncbi:efflux RND transporter permease subunit [Clostridium saccharobutylicum]|uniref:Nodulation protein NolG n=1 Tax=Clostridium saccharobutylicum DSM 13864 TaxID=1345695 RepID=U5MT62_CLOSA|nr:efflux RND transporter permease subunit [Clostridium saccharobutylicum]AGX42637.1 nodulation protein NolG [Clostridium saccharobutylicum DSM 13864]AQR89924.1 swarming motility protein SwrC [Clostridium saccharobutylicum]AQR99829.1 swarming motility protein SwrC [Clostridium saccharobutylicum]AQS09557.1 swarming motility protein SwrC [Clostridium saccharobutylicum]AQS13813.1 swarming motility protein SwrC [Clostridium saccharobutylicum]